MGEEEEICKPSCTSSTNWIVSNGSLEDSISFETPISSITDDQEDFQDSKSLKHQLVVLNPSSDSDSSPCEIKLSFKQKHEVRQVYVRSTARVFEIYYATGPQSDNEYLCTVRCGIAAKEALHSTSDTEETTLARSEGSAGQMGLEDKIKGDTNSNIDEEGWVEVKALDSASLDGNTCSVAKNIARNNERSIQDFYEATAEISDSTPCISLTLRLLSLHTKGCIHLEEIYIFCEPVEPTDSDDKAHQMNTSAGSSMMAMLLPTLLQLSGTLKRNQDKHVSDVRQELKCRYDESMDPCVGKSVLDDAESSMINREVVVESVTKGIAESQQVQVDMKHQDGESVGPYVGKAMQEERQSSLPNREVVAENVIREIPDSARTQSDEPAQAAGQGTGFVDNLNDSSSDRMLNILDQLACRVGRIEAFCLRFEENMLKPIGNIESRLGRLEQQLEVLTMRSKSSEYYPCTRITAPDFSCSDSETGSLHDDGISDVATRGTKSTRPQECLSGESEPGSPQNNRNDDHWGTESGSFVNDEAFDSTVVPQLFPCLVVTAPEYSNDDDDDDNDHDGLSGRVANGDDCTDDMASEKMKLGYPVNKPSLSIDDALAMALAGFMSSSSAPSPKTNCSWIAEAPNVQDESDGSNGSFTSARNLSNRNADSGRWFSELDGTQHSINLHSTTSDLSQDNDMRLVRSTTDGSPRDSLLQEEEADGSCGDESVNQAFAGDSNEAKGEINNYSSGDTANGYAATQTSQVNKVRVRRLSSVSSTEAVIRGCPLQEDGTDGSYEDKSVNQIMTGNGDEMTEEINDYGMEDIPNGLSTLKADSNPNLSLNDEHVSNGFVTNPDLNIDEVETMIENFPATVDIELPVRGNEVETMIQNFPTTVNFELPVLDVKFASHGHLNSTYSLETLLSDASEKEVDVENSCAEAVTQLSELPVDDELKCLEVDSLLVEIDNVGDVCLNSQIPDFWIDASENRVEESCPKESNCSDAVTAQNELS